MRPTSSGRPPPLIISAGLNGSGSTWVFNVIASIFRRDAAGFSVRTAYSDELLDDVLSGDADVTVIKTHRLSPTVQSAARLAAIPVILTVRDPKDGVASMMTRFGMTFDDALFEIERSARALAPLARSSGVLILRYEDGFTHDRATIDKLAEHLSITLPPEDRDAIWRALTPEAVRATIEKLAAEGAFAEGSPALAFDPGTHWHAGHVGSGRAGNWRTILTDRQAWDVHQATAAFRAAFGYVGDPPSADPADTHERSHSDFAPDKIRDAGDAPPTVEDRSAALVEALEARVASLEADRVARGSFIERLAAELEVRTGQLTVASEANVALVHAMEADRATRDLVIASLQHHIQTVDRDRADRLEIIERLSGELDKARRHREGSERAFEEPLGRSEPSTDG